MNETSDSTSEEARSESEQRARDFIAGVGRWFHAVGFTLFLLSCGFSLSGMRAYNWPKEPARGVADYFSEERLPYTLIGAGVAVTFIGSMLMIASGMALSGELPRGGWTSVWITAVLGILWGAVGVALGLCPGHRLSAIPYLILALVAMGMGILSLRCHLLLRDLPAVDRRRLTHDAIKAYYERRRRRLESETEEANE